MFEDEINCAETPAKPHAKRLGRELAARRAWLARCPYLQPFERERLRLVPAGKGANA